MSVFDQQSFSAKLQQLLQLIQQGQHDQLITQIKPLLAKYPKQADLYHFYAISLKAKGQLSQAITQFQQALVIQPNQPQILNNLANAYLAANQLTSAVQCYQKAITLLPNFVDAYKNLSLALEAQGEFDSAREQIEQVIKLKGKSVQFLTIKANIEKSANNFEHAVALYQEALQLAPNYVNALHNLGLTYKEMENLEFALACLKQAKQLAPNVAEIDFSLANSYFELGDYQAAEQYYLQALDKKPDYLEVHQTLNELYWQLGEKDKFGKSYRSAIHLVPNNLELRAAYLTVLTSAQNFTEVKQQLTESLTIGTTDKLLQVQANVFCAEGNEGKAISSLEQALELNFTVGTALQLVDLLIKEADYKRALTVLSKAELLAPFNQLLLAYKATCWRLLKDERYHWLIDYQAYVKPFILPCPNGYQQLSDYLDELEAVLLTMHATEHEPLQQTLKHGTQTPGRLLYKKFPVISLLKSGLSECISEYIAQLPDDDNHPLLARKSSTFEFAGSWSVKLKPNGFHVNHVHPQGWLSSSFYVKIPDLNKVEQPENAGVIKFGESSMRLGNREEIARIIQPSAGTLVLFPSYVWHGTIPFNGDETDYRMTAPFDVVPSTRK